MSDSAEIKAGYYVLAWIDILGQQGILNRIERLANVTDQVECRSEVNRVCKILNMVRDGFRTMSEIRCVNPPGNRELTDDEKEQLGRINNFEQRTIQGFGDSVIAYSPLIDNSGSRTIKPVSAFLHGCAGMLVTALSEKIPIRGAVDVGFGFDCFEGEIYGPVVASAHRLENKVAQYPRIVVGDGLLRYLARFNGNGSGSSLADRYAKSLAEYCGTLIATDIDGVPMVDFANSDFRQVYARASQPDNLSLARIFVEHERAEFIKRGDQKLALRYALLAEYLDSRIGQT